MGIGCCEGLKQFLEEEKQTQFNQKKPKPNKNMGKKDPSNNLKEENDKQKIKNSGNDFFGNFGVDKNKSDILQPLSFLNKEFNINTNTEIKNDKDSLLDKNIIITTNVDLLTKNKKDDININENITPQNDIENEINLETNKKEEKAENKKEEKGDTNKVERR